MLPYRGKFRDIFLHSSFTTPITLNVTLCRIRTPYRLLEVVNHDGEERKLPQPRLLVHEVKNSILRMARS